MSLSTQLSIDSESTWHDEDIEVDSEDWILSQVTIEILNAVNNLKGEERLDNQFSFGGHQWLTMNDSFNRWMEQLLGTVHI